MARPSKYPRELRERAVRRVVESKDAYPSEFVAIRSIADKLGIASPETLRKCVRQAEIDGGVKSGKTTAELAEIPESEEGGRRGAPGEPDPEVGVGFLRGGARPPTQVLVEFIDEHRDMYGVEPICRVLSDHGVTIAPSTYYEAAAGGPRSVHCVTLRSSS